MQEPVAEVVPLPMLEARLPVPPPPALDPVLDAASTCIARHGLGKTTLTDIARELGVAPSTVYRKVGTVENAALLITAREGHRFLKTMPDVIRGERGARAITVFLAAALAHFDAHPMVAKILTDEVDWVGRLATRGLDDLLDQAVGVASPLLSAAMAFGAVTEQDPDALAHWIVRIGVISLVTPPPGDLLDALDALLLPILEGPRT